EGVHFDRHVSCLVNRLDAHAGGPALGKAELLSALASQADNDSGAESCTIIHTHFYASAVREIRNPQPGAKRKLAMSRRQCRTVQWFAASRDAPFQLLRCKDGQTDLSPEGGRTTSRSLALRRFGFNC